MSEIKILIVEDEQKVARFIKSGLEDHDYHVDVAFDGKIGLLFFQQTDYDLILLDVNLPEINGFDLCKRIRTVNQKVPILMLTALGLTDHKVEGFESGADDYLVKPFEFRELLVRIKALLKRTLNQDQGTKILTAYDLILDRDAKTVKRGNKQIELTAKEFLLLEYLLLNKGKVISRVDIAEKIWEINFDTGTNVIDVYVSFLRKKIDYGFESKLIHTVVGMGYTIREE